MNRSIRFVIVVVALLVIASGIFLVLLWELDRSGSGTDEVPVLFNPVRDLRVGDWMEWRREDGKIERQEVVQVWNYSYAVKTSGKLPNGVVQDYGAGQARTMWDMGLGQNWRLMSMRPEKVTVAGREWNSWRVEHESKLVGVAVSWVTDEIPLGLLRRKLIRVDMNRNLPDEPGALRPQTPTKVDHNYEYLQHGYTDPAAGSGTDEDEGDG